MNQIEGALAVYQNPGAPVNGTNEVQTITPSVAPASGKFKLKYEGFETAALDFNASAAAVQTAMNAIASIGANGVSVALNEGVYTITFNGVNLAKRALALISVVENTLLSAEEAAVVMTVAESVAGVTATALGALPGALLIDTTNKDLYVNKGTESAPVWTKLLAGVTLSAATVNSLISGVTGGYKLARGLHATVTAADTVVTGLTTVAAVVATLGSDPVLTCDRATASIGDQAGAPAAGSIYIKTWMPTSNADPTPLAATTFEKSVNWIAIGT